MGNQTAATMTPNTASPFTPKGRMKELIHEELRSPNR